MIWYVHVGVALARPPEIDEYRRYAVEARDHSDAVVTALLMASCTSTMPVWAKVVGDEEFPDPDHYEGWEYPDERVHRD